MRRLPRHVILRNRNAAEADRNAQYYNRGPAKTGGPCARVMQNGQVCGKPEEDHFGGYCADWGPYTPKKPAEAVK